MGISSEFARYGATLKNVQWAVSAMIDGAAVFSLWRHRMTFESDGSWTYRDTLSRWAGNTRGNRLFAEHLGAAIAGELPIRLVMATTDNVALIESGGDGSKGNNTFQAKPDRIGRVTLFDGDAFEIFFPRPGQ